MLFIKKYISSIITAVVVLTAVLGFFSPMYAYQEGLSIFMSGGDFFADTCLRPGGMSDYIGVFLAQYFMYPHWLSIILVALVVGTQLIAKSIIIKNTNDKLADVLSVICAAGMLAAVAEFNIIFGGCVAVILALAAVRIADTTQSTIILSVITPIVYWATGGWCCIVYIIGVASLFPIKKAGTFAAINAAILLIVWLFTKKIMQDDSLIDTFAGVDFNRFPSKNCYTWHVCVWLTIACLAVSPFAKNLKSKILTIALYSAATICIIATLISKYDKGIMLDYTLDKMTRYKNWGGIVNQMGKQKSTTKISNCYLNIALNELGLLDSKMFNFLQLGSEGLASDDVDSQDESIVNSEIYFRLGLMNIAERLAIDATESNQSHQKSARQYKRLAEIAIIRKNKELAFRYLNILDKTMFYSAWAKRAKAYINNPDKVEPLTDWKIEPLTFEEHDVFFTPKYKSDFFMTLLANNQHNNKVFNYYICNLLLEKNIEQVYNFISKYRPEGELGIHIYEAIILYLSLHNPDEYKKVIAENTPLSQKFQNFCSFVMSSGGKDIQKAEELYGKTYWFYYTFCN